ncbi:hypothetical protein EV182_005139, partial [Spiromyces aspiralis]
QTLDTEYLEAFDRCCDRVIIVIAAFSGKNYQFRFEHFKRKKGHWYLCTDIQRREVDSLACPFNWP